jgi:hypothetical protein
MRFMRYYKSGVLASFQSQSDKYEVWIDEFEGKVQVTTQYYREAEKRNEKSWLNVAFGFRQCKNGDWAVAAYLPDLAESSMDEQLPGVAFASMRQLFQMNRMRALRSG